MQEEDYPKADEVIAWLEKHRGERVALDHGRISILGRNGTVSMNIGYRPVESLHDFVCFMAEQGEEPISPEEWISERVAAGIYGTVDIKDHGFFRELLNNETDLALKEGKIVTFDNGSTYYEEYQIKRYLDGWDKSFFNKQLKELLWKWI